MASAGVGSLLHYPIILTALAMDRPTGRAPSDRNMAAHPASGRIRPIGLHFALTL